MERVKSARRPVWEEFLGGYHSCRILTPEPVATVVSCRNIFCDLIFLIFLSVSLGMKRMNYLKGQL